MRKRAGKGTAPSDNVKRRAETNISAPRDPTSLHVQEAMEKCRETEEATLQDNEKQYAREFERWIDERLANQLLRDREMNEPYLVDLAWAIFYRARRLGVESRRAIWLLRELDTFFHAQHLIITKENLGGWQHGDGQSNELPKLSAATRLVEDVFADAIRVEPPTVAPAYWKKDRESEESAPDFIKRVYSKWLGKGLYRSHIRKLDMPLYGALAEYLRINPMPSDLVLPTRTERSLEEARAIQQAAERGEALPVAPDAKELARLATSLRRLTAKESHIQTTKEAGALLAEQRWYNEDSRYGNAGVGRIEDRSTTSASAGNWSKRPKSVITRSNKSQ